ncbi:MAG: hypothetical protein DCC68_00670 [Planctomycetota bacterium]|nr:MAG: hypothetical protein DCC68_00670 [Planctomycetota bacterium]
MRIIPLTLFVSFTLSQPAAAITILSQSAHLWVESSFDYSGDPADCPPGVVPFWPERLELTATDLRDFDQSLNARDPHWGSVGGAGIRSSIGEHTISIRGGAVASGVDDFCVYADGDAFAEVTVTFRLSLPRYVEVEGSASTGGAVSVRGPEHPFFADSPGSRLLETFWAASADDDGYGPGEFYYFWEFSEDRPPWPAGDYTVHGRVAQINNGPEGESGGFTISLTEVVPEPRAAVTASMASMMVAAGAAFRRRGRRQLVHSSN